MLNAILFTFFFMLIAFGMCNRFFLLFFLYIIIVLSVRIFLTLENVSWLMLLLCFIITCCFMALSLERL